MQLRLGSTIHYPNVPNTKNLKKIKIKIKRKRKRYHQTNKLSITVICGLKCILRSHGFSFWSPKSRFLSSHAILWGTIKWPDIKCLFSDITTHSCNTFLSLKAQTAWILRGNLLSERQEKKKKSHHSYEIFYSTMF